ncbi:MAG: nuclear transport factor 2 family protein [Mucilaginibacter sp.]
MKNAYILFTALIISAMCCFTANAQTDIDKEARAKSGDLYKQIAHEDSLLFIAFNSRDLNTMKTFFDPGLELFQDNQGVRNFDQVITAFGQMFKQNFILTRKLVPGSMEVYPIKDYGAIETGQHTFSHTENGKEIVGVFKFLHIWQKKDGVWKITRIVTYDH